MAIIVEDEKKRGSGAAALGWLVILVILGVGVYEIFFAPPASSQLVAPPANFAQLTSLAQISVSPQDVIASSSFQALKQYVPDPATSSPNPVGRTNPFVAP